MNTLDGYGMLELQEGTRILIDGWNMLGTTLQANEWEGADWRVESSNYTNATYSVDVKVTGRKIQYSHKGFERCLRIRVTFKDEIEEDVVVGGWVDVHSLREVFV